MAVVLFAPGLVPGRTLSASDLLWTASPWDESIPAGVQLLGSNRDQADAAQVFQPFLEKTRERLPDVPLWNPYIMAGRPYLGDAQSAVFSPFNVPGYTLPFWRSPALIAALKIFVAAFGTFLLGRALGMRVGGALLAGTVFGFSLWMVTWVSWPTVSVWAFLPWVCLLTDRLLRRPGPLPFAGLAAVVALQYFGGHPESCFHVLLFAVLFFVIRVAVLRPGSPRAIAFRALTFVGAIAAGTALAAVAVIPFLDLLGHSVDSDAREYLGPIYKPPRYLLGFFLHDYWGRQTRTTLEFPSSLEETAYYVGALTLMLVAAALVLRRCGQRLALAAIAVVAMVVATGIQPVFDLVTKLPGFAAAHNSRLAVLSVFCLALLAGWGLDDLTARPLPPRRRRLLLGGACAALLVLPVLFMAAKGTLALDRLGSAVKVAWLFQDPPRLLAGAQAALSGTSPDQVRGTVRLASLLEWLVLGGAALALVALRLRGRLGPAAFTVAAVALVALDLFKAGVGYNPAIPVAHAEQPATGAIRFLEAQRPNRFVGLDATHPGALLPPMPPNTSMRYGIYDARGYDYPIERRYHSLWRENVPSQPGCLYAFCPQTAGHSTRALHALGLMGVTHLLQARRDDPLDVRGARVAYDGPDARVYTNPVALPRAFLVERQSVVTPDDRQRAVVGSPAFDARSVAVTGAPIAGLATDGAAGSAPAGDARIADYEDERVTVRTTAPRSALLVLTDSWDAGWKATVDGREVPVHRVDYLLRGVSVPAGGHTVDFRYAPSSWHWGWIVSLATLLGLAGAVAVGLRRARA